jgi:[ribosomal protein S5]-alanine N-acetyltransferase
MPLPPLETPRLRLRPLAAADLPDLVALDRDPEVMRYVGSPAGVKTEAETEARARARILETERGAHEPLGVWRVEARDDGTFHGVGALIRMPDGLDVEVAYRLVRAAWGRGIATEAAGALIAHTLRTLDLPRLVAVTYPENRASQRVLDKLGFERRGLTEYKGVSATFHVLTREAWRARDGRRD